GREVGVVDLLGQERDLQPGLDGGVRIRRAGRRGPASRVVVRVLGGAAAPGQRQREDRGAGRQGRETSAVHDGCLSWGWCERWNRAFSCRATRGPSTETTSSTPVTMIWDCADTLARLIRFCSVPSRKTPATAPKRVPLPPSKSTPPSSTAA